MVDDQKKIDVERHIRTQLDHQKRAILLHIAEIKLKLPNHVKRMTIKQLRVAGGDIDSNFHLKLPREAENLLKQRADSIRKRDELISKFKNVQEYCKEQIIEYFRHCKQQIPQELLGKTIGDLSEEETKLLGLNWYKRAVRLS